jgi:hypothetical protein
MELHLKKNKGWLTDVSRTYPSGSLGVSLNKIQEISDVRAMLNSLNGNILRWRG